MKSFLLSLSSVIEGTLGELNEELQGETRRKGPREMRRKNETWRKVR